MSTYVTKGETVTRLPRKRDPGTGLSYERGTVTMLESARIGEGAGWDVYDVLTESGAEESAYGFDLSPCKCHKGSTCNVSHDPAKCSCSQCRKAEGKR